MDYSELLNLLWRVGQLTGRTFTGVGGESIEVVGQGEAADTEGVWQGAQVVVDGERRRGTVVVGEAVPVPDGVLFRVVCGDVAGILGADDRLVPQIRYEIAPELCRCYDDLREGAASKKCANRVARMEPVRRAELFSALLVDRLKRKTGRVMEIFDATRGDWNQTFHTMLLQAMGGDRNKEAFGRLARSITSVMVSREKGSPERLRVLLVGGAGFLDNEEFRHLAAKYSITPLKIGEWDTLNLRPVNHPVERLGQIAALLGKKDFMLDGMLACRTGEDVERLFMLPAVPVGERLSESAKGLGRAKARLVGINLVAPLMFAYGREMGDEGLCDRVPALLESIPSERNVKLAGWYDGGCEAESAFDSQALLELEGEYCSRGRCASCRVGRTEIKNALARSINAINA